MAIYACPAEVDMTQDEETSLRKFMEIGKLIQDYADLEVAKEREACAKVCEQIDIAAFGGKRPAPNDCAAAIRARGEA